MDRAFPKRARWLAGTTWDWTKAKRGRRKTKSWRTEKARTNKTRRDEPRWTTWWKYFHHARFIEKIGLSFGFQMLCQSYSDVDDNTCQQHPMLNQFFYWCNLKAILRKYKISIRVGDETEKSFIKKITQGVGKGFTLKFKDKIEKVKF